MIEKKLNTRIISTLLGTVEIKATPSEQGRTLWQKITDFLHLGFKQIAKEFDPTRDTGSSKKED